MGLLIPRELKTTYLDILGPTETSVTLSRKKVKDSARVGGPGVETHQRAMHPCGSDRHCDHSRDLENLCCTRRKRSSTSGHGQQRALQCSSDLVFGTELSSEDICRR